ncbi:MAG: hypothetical protein ACOYJ1_03325 [Peptococcales bacterium]|jgi:nitrogen regulatory protein PII
MQKDSDIYGNSLMIIIANQGMGCKVLEYVLELGIRGATVFHALGTLPNQILKMLELIDVRKDVIMIALPKCHEKELFDKMIARFHFDRLGKGIIFTLDLSGVYGSNRLSQEFSQAVEPRKMSVLQGVMTIVDKGQADRILDYVEEQGFMRGIVINAHSSADKSNKFFDLIFESEKEIILTFTTHDQTHRLAHLLIKYLNLETSNSGILAILNLQRSVGITLTLKISREENELDKMENKPGYSAIFAIVEKNMDEAVIRSAEMAGSTGGTIIHARGSCPYHRKNFFFRGVEPEREIVLIIAEDEKIKDICYKIKEDLQLDTPGKGIILVVPLYYAVGLANGG